MIALPTTFYAQRIKYRLDRVAAIGSLILLAPLFALVALAIKIDSRGPVFFKQERVGLGGRSFMIWKFRTMLTLEDSYDPAGQPLENYDRITTVGRLLRRTSLDELPQLINVAIGNMSLIGPRPTLKYQVERYTPEQAGRLLVRPGITGLAQVRGRNSIGWEEKIALDLEYIRRLSFTSDLSILLNTVRAVTARTDVDFKAHDDISRHTRDFRDDI